MNNTIIKARSRQSISWARPPVWMISAAYALLGLGAGFIVSPYPALEESATMMDIILALFGFIQRYWMLLALWLALSILLLVADAGYMKYCLDVSRNKKAGLATLFELVPQSLRYIGLGILTWLAVGIPVFALLPVIAYAAVAGLDILVLAGSLAMLPMSVVTIYIELGLAMATMVAVDNPELSITECLRGSWGLMKGRRMEFLTLRLSFIGWQLLFTLVSLYSGGLVYMAGYAARAVWLAPYIQVTCANYYSLITGRLPVHNHPPSGTDVPVDEQKPPLDEDMWKK